MHGGKRSLSLISFLQGGNHVKAGAGQKDYKADNGNGCGLAGSAVIEVEFIEIGDKGVRHVCGVASGDGPDDGEGVENIDDVQNGTYGEAGLNKGNGDLEKLAPVTGAVHGGCLVEGGVYALETAQNGEADEGDGNKDAAGDFPCEEGFGGGGPVDVLLDDWTAVTVDGGLSAHYENTVVITDGEPELLTL